LFEIFNRFKSVVYIRRSALRNVIFPAAITLVVPRSTIFYEAKKFSTL